MRGAAARRPFLLRLDFRLLTQIRDADSYDQTARSKSRLHPAIASLLQLSMKGSPRSQTGISRPYTISVAGIKVWGLIPATLRRRFRWG